MTSQSADYQSFLKTKKHIVRDVGIPTPINPIPPVLFDFQADIVRWALRKGRAAIFADTGLGKTAMQVSWAHALNVRTLIVAPLSVARQTVNESRDLLGIEVHYTRSGSNLINGINITNYEMIEHFNAADFDAVVLDESSILKNLDGKTRRLLTEMFSNTPYRLCATATPAPNDVTEIGRHAEFLGVMTNAEMLASFFVNDMKMKDGTYRLKRHAVTKFYTWLASWSMAVKKPSNLGYSDDGYVLPGLDIHPHIIDTQYTPEGLLSGFGVQAVSAIEAKNIRRQTVNERTQLSAEMVNNNSEQWLLWTGLNAEADTLESLIPDAVNVHGSMSPDEKAAHIEAFVSGKLRVLITKASIAGFGINMQNCHNMIFCGMDFSWESYYQAVRRCYRFGQKNRVNVHIVMSSQEQGVLDIVLNKEQEATKMTDELVNHAAAQMQAELRGVDLNNFIYTEGETSGADWRLLLGDSAERMGAIADNSVGLTVTSIPFMSLYTYSATERDLGNSRNADEFFQHFNFIISEHLRITQPGRNACVHVQQVAATKVNDGYIGIKDFRGDVIRAYTAAGWIFHGEVTIDKNPQVQAIRTKTKGLMFVQMEKDSAASRPAFADYVLIFQKPGENATPVKPQCTREEWIQWAHAVWYDINETDTLNVAVARSNEDERHLCPLQLGLIERCIRLWSNRGDVVFDPFAGIGSTGWVAVQNNRKFLGCELKPEYHAVASKYLAQAVAKANQPMLFSDDTSWDERAKEAAAEWEKVLEEDPLF